MVEQPAVNRFVPGSSPGRGAFQTTSEWWCVEKREGTCDDVARPFFAETKPRYWSPTGPRHDPLRPGEPAMAARTTDKKKATTRRRPVPAASVGGLAAAVRRKLGLSRK